MPPALRRQRLLRTWFGVRDRGRPQTASGRRNGISVHRDRLCRRPQSRQNLDQRSLVRLLETANDLLGLGRVLYGRGDKRLLLLASHTGKLTGNALGLALAARDSSDF